MVDINYQTSLSIGASATVSRASTASVLCNNGWREALDGEIRLRNARRVRNLIAVPEDFTDASWSNTSIGVTSGVSDPDGGNSAFTLTSLATNSLIKYDALGFRSQVNVGGSFWVRRRTGTGSIYLALSGSLRIVTSLITSSWQRIGLVDPSYATAARWLLRIAILGDELDVYHPQLEKFIADENDLGEYVSNGALSFPYHGVGVDGVKHFNSVQANTASGNPGVITESTGANIADPISLLIERGGATNLADGDEDLSVSAETVTLPGTGNYTISVPGVTLKTVSVAAGTATITGAGNATESVPLTINCTAAGTITLTLSVGLLDAHDGLSIKQVESGSTATSWMPTSGVSADRSADLLTYTEADLELGAITVTYLDSLDAEQTSETDYHSYDTGTDVLTIGSPTLPSKIVSIVTDDAVGGVPAAVFQNSNQVIQ